MNFKTTYFIILYNVKFGHDTCFFLPCSVLSVLIALSLLHIMICYTPIATFQKAGTCLDAQQSMAKQPIKGCVSNQNRMCGKSVSEKSE